MDIRESTLRTIHNISRFNREEDQIPLLNLYNLGQSPITSKVFLETLSNLGISQTVTRRIFESSSNPIEALEQITRPNRFGVIDINTPYIGEYAEQRYRAYLGLIQASIRSRLAIVGVIPSGILDVLSEYQINRQINYGFSSLMNQPEASLRRNPETPFSTIMKYRTPHRSGLSISRIAYENQLPNLRSNRSLNSIIERFERPEEIQLAQIIRTPMRRHREFLQETRLGPPEFARHLSDLRQSKDNTIRDIENYLRYICLNKDETTFTYRDFATELANATHNRFTRSINVTSSARNFARDKDDVNVRTDTNFRINATPEAEIQYRETLSGFVPSSFQRFLDGSYEEIRESHLDQDFHTFDTFRMSIRESLRDVIQQTPDNIKTILEQQGRHDVPKSFSFVIVLRFLRDILSHDFLTHTENQLLNFNPDQNPDHHHHNFSFYLFSYILFHMEINQFIRFIKLIAVVSNLDNNQLENLNLQREIR